MLVFTWNNLAAALFQNIPKHTFLFYLLPFVTSQLKLHTINFAQNPYSVNEGYMGNTINRIDRLLLKLYLTHKGDNSKTTTSGIY